LLLPLNHTSEALDPLGVMYALLAAAGWAFYSLVGRKAGREFGESAVVGAGMTVAAVALLPLALVQPGHVEFTPGIAIAALLMSVLSSALPFQLEIIAITRLPTRVYSTLSSLEPAVGTLTGLLFLREIPSVRQVIGITAIMAASVGTALAMEARPTAGEP
jgi:inner membrane transporter RhtA